ncbi:SAM-dependent methyltransferase [Streptomyces pinistramenti]|uniref:SAM-dependent methyltransferase n=1 Tax=Streptomyces pinistramenti TaxID=2884812 RepID=UPI001D08FFED|nr:SAM-dependent methyltransferase [Streptomyces pinistramenti]MCB5910785.1 SAM-dependent methyltransferase [Streptomyces pinistramenti]
MSLTLVRQQLADSPSTDSGPPPDAPPERALDRSGIPERMLTPLYEAVYARLGVGPGTRLLGLGCRGGLALGLAASRGALVSGVDAEAAHERAAAEGAAPAVRVACGGPDSVAGDGPFTVVTAFHPLGGAEDAAAVLRAAAGLAERGGAVVLGGWGPAERCAAAGVLGAARRTAGSGAWRPSRRDDLEELAERAGLRLDGSGRVACPFGYPDLASAVCGLLSMGADDGGREPLDEGLRAALRPYLRADGSVWLPNVFRYLIARTP